MQTHIARLLAEAKLWQRLAEEREGYDAYTKEVEAALAESCSEVGLAALRAHCLHLNNLERAAAWERAMKAWRRLSFEEQPVAAIPPPPLKLLPSPPRPVPVYIEDDFLSDMCIRDVQATAPLHSLYTAYKAYGFDARGKGWAPLGRILFSRWLVEGLGFTRVRDRYGCTCIVGLRLRNAADAAEASS